MIHLVTACLYFYGTLITIERSDWQCSGACTTTLVTARGPVPYSQIHPRLIFAGKAGAYSSRNPYGNPLQGQAPSHACKHKTSTDVTNSGKHSSLPRYGINDDCEQFIVEVCERDVM